MFVSCPLTWSAAALGDCMKIVFEFVCFQGLVTYMLTVEGFATVIKVSDWWKLCVTA